MFLKLVGIGVVVLGLGLLVTALGLPLIPLTFINEIWGVILGIVLIILGIAIVKGKEPSL